MKQQYKVTIIMSNYINIANRFIAKIVNKLEFYKRISVNFYKINSFKNFCLLLSLLLNIKV